MQKQIEQLEHFHKVFGCVLNDKPTLLTAEQSSLRYDMSLEELNEYRDAVEENNIVGVLDSIVDRIYLAIGDAVAHGLTDILIESFNEVHSSNMSKLDKDGNAIINGEGGMFKSNLPLGKVLKSAYYRKPDLKTILENHLGSLTIIKDL